METIAGIPVTPAPVGYVNDPETEDLIWGSSLREGMVILIEDNLIRGNPDRAEIDGAYTLARVRETAYWCRIVNIRPIHEDIITFIGIYADGTKRSRTYNVSYAWYVKIASMNRGWHGRHLSDDLTDPNGA